MALAALLAAVGCDVATPPEERLVRAERLLDAGRYNEAVVEIRNALENQPDDARALLDLARAAVQIGIVDSAKPALDRAAAAGAGPVAVADRRARLQLQSGEFAPLLEALEAGRIPVPEPRRSELRARALAGLERCDAAVEAAYALRAAAPDAHVMADIVLAECFAH